MLHWLIKSNLEVLEAACYGKGMGWKKDIIRLRCSYYLDNL